MKRTITILFACQMATAIAVAQRVHSVPANSKGNQLIFTIANASQTIAAQDVQVRVVKYPSAIVFTLSRQTISLLAARNEIDVQFTFDVSRPATVNTTDTMEFLISDKNGTTWKKLVTVMYEAPATYALEQNFPNPFNPITTIYYQLPIEGKVTLKVYDVLGREIKTLVDEQQQAGYREARFDASNLSNGVYFYRLQVSPTEKPSKAFASVRKMLLLK